MPRLYWQLVMWRNEILVQRRYMHASRSPMLKKKHHKKSPPLDSHVKAKPFTKYSNKHASGRTDKKKDK
jgi:hypothetical protein